MRGNSATYDIQISTFDLTNFFFVALTDHVMTTRLLHFTVHASQQFNVSLFQKITSERWYVIKKKFEKKSGAPTVYFLNVLYYYKLYTQVHKNAHVVYQVRMVYNREISEECTETSTAAEDGSGRGSRKARSYRPMAYTILYSDQHRMLDDTLFPHARDNLHW